MNGDWPSPMPIVPGHEAAGEIAEVGPGVTTVKPGDHVIFSFRPHCGRCRYCSHGRTVLCMTATRAAGRALRRHLPHQAQGPGHQPDGAHRHLRRGGRGARGDGGADPQGHAVAAGRAGRLLRGDRRRRGDAPRQDRGGLDRAGDRLRRRRAQRGAGRHAVAGAGIIAADILDNKLEMAKTFGATHTINTKTNEDAVKKVKEMAGGLGVDYAFDAVSNDRHAGACLRFAGARRPCRGTSASRRRRSAPPTRRSTWCSPRRR